jgi:hypothetical protein
MIQRREFLTSAAGFGAYAFLREVRAFVPAAQNDRIDRWLRHQDELARSLSSGAMSQLQWHEDVTRLSRDVDVEELAHALSRAQTRSTRLPSGHEPLRRFIDFRNDDGTNTRLAYGAAVFTFDRDSVIAPHAHKHMASAHMVIEGKLRIRKYDRVEDRGDALILRPTADEIAEVGDSAAMTSAKDNVHWFAARSHRAMTFDVIVDKLDAGEKNYEVQPVDILGATDLRNGLMRAPLLSFEQSREKYSAEV